MVIKVSACPKPVAANPPPAAAGILLNTMFDALGLPPLEIKRSPKWAAVERRYKKAHPNCENCGGSEKVVVHHKVPVHIDPTKELDATNLKSLCEKPSMNCHLWQGHDGVWKSMNQTVDSDCEAFLKRIENRP